MNIVQISMKILLMMNMIKSLMLLANVILADLKLVQCSKEELINFGSIMLRAGPEICGSASGYSPLSSKLCGAVAGGIFTRRSVGVYNSTFRTRADRR